MTTTGYFWLLAASLNLFALGSTWGALHLIAAVGCMANAVVDACSADDEDDEDENEDEE